jgi:anti-sigma factor RsiW
MDGEAGERTAQTRDHVERCRECQELIAAWQHAGDELRAMVDEDVGQVDPLLALQNIRDRIAAAESRTLGSRLVAWWEELWLVNRRAVAGVVAATALGALVAPGAVFLLGKTAPTMLEELTGPAVVVEALEVGGNATAVVWGGAGETSTLIWVEPGADDSHEGTF